MKKKFIISKYFFVFVIILISSQVLFSQETGTKKLSALDIKNQCVKYSDVHDSIDYIKSNLENLATPSDKRSVLYFLASLQEQLGLFTDAGKSYAKSAAIGARNAEGFPAVTTETIVLSAVRCVLNCGDWETAQSYLNSSVRNSKNENTLALIKLYSVWTDLCKATSYSETKDSVALLKAYSQMESMKSVRSSVLFTIWYIDEDADALETLKKSFSSTPEYAVASGKLLLSSNPFWYFVPRKNYSLASTENISSSQNAAEKPSVASEIKNEAPVTTTDTKPAAITETQNPSPQAADTTSKKEETKHSVKKQQTGLFKNKANAEELVQKLKDKGFDAYIKSETRSSGTLYYLVLVDENESLTMGNLLRAKGFDCYMVE